VQELLPALDLFVLSSRFEGLPISLLEAMAAEVCCVSTSVGGIPEAVRDGHEGRLVDPGNPSTLGDTLSDLLRDDGARRRLAASGRARVTEAFSIQRAVRRVGTAYAGLPGD